MSYETLELLIDGKFRAGSGGEAEAVLNPATEDTLADVPHASAAARHPRWTVRKSSTRPAISWKPISIAWQSI